MAFIQCDFFSETLEMSSSVNVIIPQQTSAQIGMAGHSGSGKHPVLWLLHGRTDDHTIWMRRTSIERYVSELGIAVVMPNAHLSWYNNARHGLRYFDFLSEELPRICRSFFPFSARREDNFIAGLSMGGYGSFLQALRNPQNYAAAASLSGALDIARHIATIKEDGASPYLDWQRNFDDPTTAIGSDSDLLALAERARANGTDLPALYACCGTEDFLYDHNQKFCQHMSDLSLPLTYEEGPGMHDWAFWDQWIQRVLAWLPIEHRA